MSEPFDQLLRQIPSRERVFDEGSFLFRQEDNVRVIHQVMEGFVHLIRYQPNGSALILQRAEAGSILAEASLFSTRYHCDAVAAAATRTRVFERLALRNHFAAVPAFAEAWAAHLSREVQRTRERAELLSLKTVAERLDAWVTLNGGRLPPKGEWKHVATQIGVSPEALYRELAGRRKPPGARR